jgi:drug/metabolite transporter (DMT)-like permease
MEPSNPLKAAAWMMGAVVSFTAMAVAGRELQQGMDTFELMLYRSVIGFAIVLGILARSRRGFSQVRSGHLALHLKRNLFHYTGQNLWFFAVATIPLSQLVALEFTNPIWVALLAPFLLGERLTRSRVLAAALGFLGVLIVAEPGAAPIEPGHIAALCAAVGFALNTIFTRQLMRFDSVLCVLFWMTLLQGAASLVLALPGRIPGPTLGSLPWILVIGVTGLTAHYALTSALGHAPASIVAPMEFIRLPLIALVGMWVYGEPLRLAVFIGAILIIAGNLMNLRAETRRARA